MLNRRNASDFPVQLSHCSILETYLREAFGNESNRDPMTRTDLSLSLPTNFELLPCTANKRKRFDKILFILHGCTSIEHIGERMEFGAGVFIKALARCA